MRVLSQAQIYQLLNIVSLTPVAIKNLLPNQIWFVYIIRCRNNTLYTGVTMDINRRFAEHQAQGNKCAKYLRGKAPLKLALTAKLQNKENAYQVEKHIKLLSKQQKEQLLRSTKGYK